MPETRAQAIIKETAICGIEEAMRAKIDLAIAKTQEREGKMEKNIADIMEMIKLMVPNNGSNGGNPNPN